MTEPTLRDRLRPIELVLLSAGMALFVGLTVLLTTRDFVLAGVFFGIAFIVVLVVIAMFALTHKPNAAEVEAMAHEQAGAEASAAAGAASTGEPRDVPRDGDRQEPRLPDPER